MNISIVNFLNETTTYKYAPTMSVNRASRGYKISDVPPPLQDKTEGGTSPRKWMTLEKYEKKKK